LPRRASRLWTVLDAVWCIPGLPAPRIPPPATKPLPPPPLTIYWDTVSLGWDSPFYLRVLDADRFACCDLPCRLPAPLCRPLPCLPAVLITGMGLITVPLPVSPPGLLPGAAFPPPIFLHTWEQVPAPYRHPAHHYLTAVPLHWNWSAHRAAASLPGTPLPPPATITAWNGIALLLCHTTAWVPYCACRRRYVLLAPQAGPTCATYRDCRLPPAVHRLRVSVCCSRFRPQMRLLLLEQGTAAATTPGRRAEQHSSLPVPAAVTPLGSSLRRRPPAGGAAVMHLPPLSSTFV